MTEYTKQITRKGGSEKVKIYRDGEYVYAFDEVVGRAEELANRWISTQQAVDA